MPSIRMIDHEFLSVIVSMMRILREPENSEYRAGSDFRMGEKPTGIGDFSRRARGFPYPVFRKEEGGLTIWQFMPFVV